MDIRGVTDDATLYTTVRITWAEVEPGDVIVGKGGRKWMVTSCAVRDDVWHGELASGQDNMTTMFPADIRTAHVLRYIDVEQALDECARQLGACG